MIKDIIGKNENAQAGPKMLFCKRVKFIRG